MLVGQKNLGLLKESANLISLGLLENIVYTTKQLFALFTSHEVNVWIVIYDLNSSVYVGSKKTHSQGEHHGVDR